MPASITGCSMPRTSVSRVLHGASQDDGRARVTSERERGRWHRQSARRRDHGQRQRSARRCRPRSTCSTEFGVAARGADRLGPPHARRHDRVRPHRRRPGPRGDHRRRRRRRPPARDDRVDDAAAGDRRPGPARAPRRHGLAALDRADAQGHPRRHRRGRQRHATPACSRCGSSPPPTTRCATRMEQYQESLAAMVRGEGRRSRRALSERLRARCLTSTRLQVVRSPPCTDTAPTASSRDVPHVVVDGSAQPGTVLVLSHWPGMPTPDALRADLSAEIAFHYLDHPELHVDAEFVTEQPLRPGRARERVRARRDPDDARGAARPADRHRARRRLRHVPRPRRGARRDRDREPRGRDRRRPVPRAARAPARARRPPRALPRPLGRRGRAHHRDRGGDRRRHHHDHRGPDARPRRRARPRGVAGARRAPLHDDRRRASPIPTPSTTRPTASWSSPSAADAPELRYRYETWVHYVSTPTAGRVSTSPTSPPS